MRGTTLLLLPAILSAGLFTACGDATPSPSNSGGGGSAALCTPASAKAVCIDTAFKFNPNPLTVPVGSQVIFTNNSTATHTATSDASAPAPFDTGQLAVGSSFTVTFAKAGSYTYHCAIHSSMSGTVTVQ